ncbi:hypothetical protein SAMN05192575_11414 [Nocardioides alpinus]|uniref:Membrane protein YfhO n=1 Tax=Nocardioides alpinus TaxID=748909 RepID=A0A1I1B593_9ACTN|nr:hypothetical protein [Nocardioides alpinus]PKH41366.1 hypothetical protein CXG46_09785 [Nocardioides alpinus]SFB45534.1 hypothetical protein SAMN05192575_11414 [Nocardioides alpinus]
MVPARRWNSRPWQDWLVTLWPLALSLVLVLPLLVRPGHPLARDLVFVPRQPFTDSTWGLGDVAPRAVPVDSVVAALTHLVDGGVLARLILPLSLALLGWGVARLLAPLGRTAQVAGSGFAVWNAFVVERLAMGQWALLLGCAALPWLVDAAMRYRRDGRRGDLAAAIAWTALASLTPTGGLFALAGLLAAATPHLRRLAALLGAGLALQAPWLVAALTGPAAAVSDSSGVAAFAPDTESPFGSVVALLGLGGIWDAGAEPATRTTWWAPVAALAVVLVLAVGLPALRRVWGGGDLARWCMLSGVLAAVALSAATSWGADLMVWLVQTVPGAGLARDTQKLLAPAVVLVAAAFGACAARISRALATNDLRWPILLVVALGPVLLLPDATTRTWPTVHPVVFPADFEATADLLAGHDRELVVTLPWRAYRAFAWGRPGMTSSDPAVRMFDAEVVTSDSLQVGAVLVPGEGRLAAAVGEALDEGPPAQTLPALGVSWVVVYPDDEEAAQLDLSGLEPVRLGEFVELYRVPDAVIPDAPVWGVRRLSVWMAHLAALGLALAAAATRIVARRERDANGQFM